MLYFSKEKLLLLLGRKKLLSQWTNEYFWLVQLYYSAVKEAFYLKDITAVTTPELLVINESYINYDNWIWKTGKQVAQQDLQY